MKLKIKLISLGLLLTPALSFANWTSLGQNEDLGVKIFYDTSSIIKNEGLTSIKILFDFKKINQDFNKPHLSEVEVNEFNCSKNLIRIPKVSWYSKSKAKGSVIWETKNLEWQSIPKNTAYSEIFKIACKKN